MRSNDLRRWPGLAQYLQERKSMGLPGLDTGLQEHGLPFRGMKTGGKMQRKRKLVKGTHFVANAWGWRGWTALKIWSLESKPPVRLSCNQAIPGLWLALSTWALVSSHCRLRMADLPYFLSVDPVPVPCSLFLVPGKTAYILTSKALDLVFVSEVYSFLV